MSCASIEQPVLDLGRMVIGVDPGSKSMGVAMVDGGGRVVHSWTLRPPAGSLLRRQAWLYCALRKVLRLTWAEKRDGELRDLAVEEGIFRAVPTVIGILGEMRGLIMAAAWEAGLRVVKVHPLTWKAGLSKPERQMKKGADYTAYWNRQLGIECRSPDEVDAVMIARRVAVGR